MSTNPSTSFGGYTALKNQSIPFQDNKVFKCPNFENFHGNKITYTCTHVHDIHDTMSSELNQMHYL